MRSIPGLEATVDRHRNALARRSFAGADDKGLLMLYRQVIEAAEELVERLRECEEQRYGYQQLQEALAERLREAYRENYVLASQVTALGVAAACYRDLPE